MSSDGKYIAFVDNDGEVIQYTRADGSLTLITNQVGQTTASGGVASLPSMNHSGAVILFNSTAANLMSRDQNSEQDVFVSFTPVAPTDILTSVPGVPDAAHTTFATLTTDADSPGRTFNYSLVDTTNFPDNNFFTIAGNQLSTGNNFPNSGQTTYTIRIHVEDAADNTLFFEKTITLNLVTLPTNITTTLTTVPATPNTTFTTLMTTPAGNNRTLTYAFVTGTGDTDNGFFSIDGDQLITNGNFPSSDPSHGNTYTILVRTTDQTYPSLFVDQVLTFTLVTAPDNILLSSIRVP